MTEQEKRLIAAQDIILAAMQETKATFGTMPESGIINSRLGWINDYSKIMLRLSEAMANVKI